MIAAAAVSCDALDGDGQIAIALRDHGRQLVYLLGRFRGRFDFDPAADAIEDDFAIEGIGCRQHDVACDCHSVMRRWAQARNLEITNEFRVRSKAAIADLDSDIAELGKPGFARFTRTPEWRPTLSACQVLRERQFVLPNR